MFCESKDQQKAPLTTRISPISSGSVKRESIDKLRASMRRIIAVIHSKLSRLEGSSGNVTGTDGRKEWKWEK